MAMIEKIEQTLSEWGVSETHLQLYTQIVGIAAMLLAATASYLVARLVVLRIAKAVAGKTATQWDNTIIEQKVIFWLIHLVPAIVIHQMAAFSFDHLPTWQHVLQVASIIYIIVVGAMTVSAFLNAVEVIYSRFSFAREIPITGLIQVVKILIALLAVVFVISHLLGKSPLILLSGLGALTAVLMLIFKDPILGLVGGIQLSMNRMVAKGDWIEMPKYGADGEVTDVLLTTVKVSNWDKTITTVPTYALISDSFKNWRGMERSGGRRIKRQIHIDVTTIKLCTPEMLERFSRIQHIAEYIGKKEQELVEWNKTHATDESITVNGRRMTNVGTFRAYIKAYLLNHPKINKQMTLLVRQLQPGAQGLPIEVYCFSADKAWANYEDIQSDIFDHLFAVAREFDLEVFQNPTGRDLARLGGEIGL